MKGKRQPAGCFIEAVEARRLLSAAEFSVGDITVNESTWQAVFHVTLDAPASGDVQIGYLTTPGTAKLFRDFSPRAGILTIADGKSSGDITIPVINDNAYEGSRTFRLKAKVLAPGGQFHTATATITDDESQPTISVPDVSIAEGNSGWHSVPLTVTLNEKSRQPVSVTYSTVDGTATAGFDRSTSDYRASAHTVRFAPGQTSRTIRIVINGDANTESDETFGIHLSHPKNATGAADGTITITNDDGVEPGALVQLVSPTTLSPVIGVTPTLYTAAISSQLLTPVSTFDTSGARLTINYPDIGSLMDFVNPQITAVPTDPILTKYIQSPDTILNTWVGASITLSANNAFTGMVSNYPAGSGTLKLVGTTSTVTGTTINTGGSVMVVTGGLTLGGTTSGNVINVILTGQGGTGTDSGLVTDLTTTPTSTNDPTVTDPVTTPTDPMTTSTDPTSTPPDTSVTTGDSGSTTTDSTPPATDSVTTTPADPSVTDPSTGTTAVVTDPPTDPLTPTNTTT